MRSFTHECRVHPQSAVYITTSDNTLIVYGNVHSIRDAEDLPMTISGNQSKNYRSDGAAVASPAQLKFLNKKTKLHTGKADSTKKD